MRIPPVVRFLLEAAFLVLVVVIAAVAGLDTLWIGVLMFGAGVLVAIVEASALRRSRHRRRAVAEAPRAPAREPAPEPESLPQRVVAPRAWNLWELEQLAEEMNEGARAEERTLLLLHMREFADPSGDLPREFDPLVREVFGTDAAELMT
jgi:hypothetical protein